MKKRNAVISVLLALTLGTSLCACAAGSEGAGETAAGQEKADVQKTEHDLTKAAEGQEQYDIDAMEVSGATVKLYHRLNAEGGDPESEYFLRKVEEWNKQDNGITIETVFLSTENDYLDRLATDIASGDAPDIFMQYGGTNCLDYVEEEVVLNLTPYLEYDQEWYNGFVKANWAPVDFTKFGHEGVYGAPWSAYEILLYYNEDYLKDCSLEVPKSWDDLVKCCEVLKEKGYQPFLAGEGDNYKYAHNLSVMAAKAYGPEFQDKLAAREYTYESPEIIDLIQKLKDMQDNGYFGENILSVDAKAERSYFGAGDCAFMIDLSRGGAVLADSECFKKGNIHAAKFPYLNEEYATINMGGASQSYFVCTLNKSEEQIQASLKVLKWLTSTEFVDGLVENYANTYSVIPSEGIIDNYLFEECNNLMGETTEYVGELAQASTNTAELTIVRNALQLLASGSTPEEVGREIMENLANYE